MANETLKIAIIQLDLVWENAPANRAKIDQLLQQIPDGTDLVFLPEMFNSGFTMNTDEVAETMQGETINWMKTRCSEHQFALCGSLIVNDNNLYYNRLVFISPDGKTEQYNKRHLFPMAGEEKHIAAGAERVIIDYKGWRICPMICYDLRFPVWSRNQNDYDILVYVANWPSARIEAWNTLLKARAIENQAYVVGANRIGMDANNTNHAGNSQLIGPNGNIIAVADSNSESIISSHFSYSELINLRIKFPVSADADKFTIL